jgi:hypothetical protein
MGLPEHIKHCVPGSSGCKQKCAKTRLSGMLCRTKGLAIFCVLTLHRRFEAYQCCSFAGISVMLDVTPNSMGYVNDKNGSSPAAYMSLQPFNNVNYFHNCSMCSSTCGIQGVYEVMASGRSPYGVLLQRQTSLRMDLQPDGEQAQQCRIMSLPVRCKYRYTLWKGWVKVVFYPA